MTGGGLSCSAGAAEALRDLEELGGGRDRVNARHEDAVRLELDTHRPAEMVLRRLGRGVRAVARQCELGDTTRTHEQVPGALLLDQPGCRHVDEIHRREEIDLEDVPELLLGDLVRRFLEAVAGVGEDDVEPVESLLCRIEQAGRRAGVRHVPDDRLRQTARGANLPGHDVEAFGPAGVEHDVHSGTRALNGRRGANPGTGAGNDDHLALEIDGHGTYVWRTPVLKSAVTGTVAATRSAKASSCRVRCGSMIRSTQPRAAP